MLKAPIEAYFTSDVPVSKAEAKALEEQIQHLDKHADEWLDALTLSEDYDMELTRQSSKYGEVTKWAAAADSTADMVKLVLSNARAIAALKTREAYEDEDVSTLPFRTNNAYLGKLAKATEAVVEAAVESYDMIYALNHLLIQAKQVQAKFRGADDSWVQRSISLNALSARQVRLYGMPEDYRAESARKLMAQERS